MKSLIASCLFSLICIVSSANSALAQTRLAEVQVKASVEPVQATGLILSPFGISEVTETKVSSLKPGIFVVSFAVPEDAAKEADAVSAIVQAADGSVSYGSVNSIPVPGRGETLSGLPDCTAPNIAAIPADGQDALLVKLIRVRSQRREISRQHLATLLDKLTLDRLSKMETGFGLQASEPLSPTLPVTELNQRLFNLLAAVTSFDKSHPPVSR